jgi:fluoride exporter
MSQQLLYVSIGAIFGAALRFLSTSLSSELSHHHGFPYGTLIVNVVGSFLVGFVLTWRPDHAHDSMRLLLATGFCGAFTTFSAFAYESMAYWHEGRMLLFAANLLLNNVLCFVGVTGGIALHNSR